MADKFSIYTTYSAVLHIYIHIHIIYSTVFMYIHVCAYLHKTLDMGKIVQSPVQLSLISY